MKTIKIPLALTGSLTIGANTFVGGAANDVFNFGTADSLSAFDNLDGGAGANDTFTALITTAALPGGLTVKNIETTTVNTTGAGFVGTFTGWTGLTNLTVQSSGNGAPVTVTAASTTSVTTASTTSVTAVGATENAVAGLSDVTIIGGWYCEYCCLDSSCNKRSQRWLNRGCQCVHLGDYFGWRDCFD